MGGFWHGLPDAVRPQVGERACPEPDESVSGLVTPWSSQAEPLVEVPTPDAACACEEASPLVAGGLGLQPLLSRPGRPLLERREAPKQL